MRNFHCVSVFFLSVKLPVSTYLRIGFVISAILIFCFSGEVFQFSAHANSTVNNTVKIKVTDQGEKVQNTSGNPTISSKTKIQANSEITPIQVLNLTGNMFFVAPNGTSSGNGSINNPWDLKTAFNHPAAVQPGDTIYLRGGIYNVPAIELGFISRLMGTLENPIKMMSYPGEWAVIDGNLSNSQVKNVTMLKILGNYTWYRDFEMMNSEVSNRKIAISGSNPPERRGGGIEDRGIGTKFINLVIHDTGQGVSSFSGGRNGEYYGNIVYNNGWDAPDRLHGHGTYTQNNSDFKRFEDNVFFNGFGNNSQMYGSNAASCRNFTWIGNIMFNGGMAWWGPNIENLIVKENQFYNQQFQLNYNVNPTNINADVRNNYFMFGISLGEFAQNITFKNNTVWHTGTGTFLTVKTINFWTPSKFTVADNTYYKSGRGISLGQFKVYYINKSREFAFNRTVEPQRYASTKKSWQEDLGLDTNSTYIDSAPSGVNIFVRPNKYESGRANIIIYNWNQANMVNVDVSSILQPGDTYKLHNVQDYFGDVTTGTYSGGSIDVNMTERTRAKPIGYDQVSSWYHDPLKPNTFPTFGVFVLIKTNGN